QPLPYGCPHCPSTFARRQTLRSHLSIHTPDRPHACPHCPARFRRRQEMLRHARSLH
ncbi:hypothetical protein BC829DRAFT_347359, partial [Chytridium lagenaria]